MSRAVRALLALMIFAGMVVWKARENAHVPQGSRTYCTWQGGHGIGRFSFGGRRVCKTRAQWAAGR
jgi:hypothetical protein